MSFVCGGGVHGIVETHCMEIVPYTWTPYGSEHSIITTIIGFVVYDWMDFTGFWHPIYYIII
jgi:hypothetical protein